MVEISTHCLVDGKPTQDTMSVALGKASLIDLIQSGALSATIQRTDLVLANGFAKVYDLHPTLKKAGVRWHAATKTWRKPATAAEREALEKLRAAARALKKKRYTTAAQESVPLDHVSHEFFYESMRSRTWIGMTAARARCPNTTALHVLGSGDAVARWNAFHDRGAGMYV